MNCAGVIDMTVCYKISCLSRLNSRVKAHKLNRGKEHKCGEICNRQLTDIHRGYHEEYHGQQLLESAKEIFGAKEIN